MMLHARAALPALALALAAPLASAAGQGVGPACAAQTVAQDACQKAADIFAFLAPQLGAAVAGGNATIGQGGNLGGLGRFAFSVRLTGMRGELPRVDDVAVRPGPAEASEFAVSDQWFGMPQVDLGIGLTRGLPLALTNVGGVDLLVSASWLPEVSTRDVELRATDGQFRFGGGVRVGILQETPAVPGVSVSLLRRALPRADLTVRAGDDTLSALGASIVVDSWRLVASKQLFAVGFAAGVGQDRHDAETDVSAVVNEGGVRVAPGVAAFEQRMTRTNAFVSAGLHVGVLRLVGEVGSTWGGEAATLNTFAGSSPTEQRLYGSVGLRLGL